MANDAVNVTNTVHNQGRSVDGHERQLVIGPLTLVKNLNAVQDGVLDLGLDDGPGSQDRNGLIAVRFLTRLRRKGLTCILKLFWFLVGIVPADVVDDAAIF